MRTTSLAAALLAAAALAAAPAHAAEPITVCSDVSPDLDWVCGTVDPYYALHVLSACSAVHAADHPDGRSTYVFGGAVAYAPYATEISLDCWTGTVHDRQTMPGKVFVQQPRTVDGPTYYGAVCERYGVRLEAGNPYGLAPGVTHYSDTFCY